MSLSRRLGNVSVELVHCTSWRRVKARVLDTRFPSVSAYTGDLEEGRIHTHCTVCVCGLPIASVAPCSKPWEGKEKERGCCRYWPLVQPCTLGLFIAWVSFWYKQFWDFSFAYCITSWLAWCQILKSMGPGWLRPRQVSKSTSICPPWEFLAGFPDWGSSTM